MNVPDEVASEFIGSLSSTEVLTFNRLSKVLAKELDTFDQVTLSLLREVFARLSEKFNATRNIDLLPQVKESQPDKEPEFLRRPRLSTRPPTGPGPGPGGDDNGDDGPPRRRPPKRKGPDMQFDRDMFDEPRNTRSRSEQTPNVEPRRSTKRKGPDSQYDLGLFDDERSVRRRASDNGQGGGGGPSHKRKTHPTGETLRPVNRRRVQIDEEVQHIRGPKRKVPDTQFDRGLFDDPKNSVAGRQAKSTMQREFDNLERDRQARYQEHQRTIEAIQQRHDELHRNDRIPDPDALGHLQEFHTQAEHGYLRDEDGFQRRLAGINQRFGQIQEGSGIFSMEKPPNHIPFGRHVIHLPSLEDGVLNVKYRSLTRNPKIPKVKLSDKLQDLLMHSIEGGKIDTKKAHSLCRDDQALLSKVCSIARIESPLVPMNDDDRDRFEVVCGELRSGSTSELLKKELKVLLLKLQSEGRISHTEAAKTLYDLTI